ncbi:unnamed protein product [Lymnaea stagnalis]|uniref:Serpin domain-containing protein n=1 Tax=Lymnaea stagnalis TaxID=6523 RepID=A0AAV2IM02_LYMST
MTPLSCVSCCSTGCQFNNNLHRVMKSPCLLVALAVASYTTSHCLCAIADNGPTLPPIPDLQNLAKAISFFSMDLHTVLRETRDSFFFSPVSIHLALSMAIVGAKGATSKELKITLEVSKIRNLNEQYKGWLAWAPDNCNLGKDCEIQLNKTYLINPDISVDEKFTVKRIKNLEEQYKGWLDTTTDNCNLGKDCEMQLNKTYMISSGVKAENKFATTINLVYTPSEVDLKTTTGWTYISFFPSRTQWTQEDPLLAMIVNILNLRLRWKRKFIYNKGNYMDFTTSTFKNIKTTSMRAMGHFGYAFSHELNGHVLKIPFENDRFGFYIIQPTTADGLEKLEGKLARRSLHLDQVLDLVVARNVLVELPLLRIGDGVELEEPLQKLGINAAFSDDADFTNATPMKCNIGQAVHAPLIDLGLSYVTIGTQIFLNQSEEADEVTSTPKTTLSENVNGNAENDTNDDVKDDVKGDVGDDESPKDRRSANVEDDATLKTRRSENVTGNNTPKNQGSEKVIGDKAEKLVRVKASHPFLFFVRDDLYGVLIIQGRMLEPVNKIESP